MASSRKSPTSKTLIARVAAILEQHVERGNLVVVGLSGGIDSVVLLDALQRLSHKHHFELAALHVDHQINPASGRWAAFCRSLCRKRGIKCKVVRVTVPSGDSLEAAARAVRYRAYTAVRADFIALAHNLDDQAETVLLQLLRGAGVKGLSAMPVIRIEDRGSRIEDRGARIEDRGARIEDRGSRIEQNRKTSAQRKLNPQSSILNPVFLRPLLETPRSEILTYARRRKLAWVEDDSNADPEFDRNFLRHQVLPIIARRYPAYREVLSRASRHFAEAAQLLDKLAAADAEPTAEFLSLTGLRRLSVARAKNAVRCFLAVHGVSMPNAARLDECARQIFHATRGTRMAMKLDSHSLLQFGDDLRLVVKRDELPPIYGRVWRGESRLLLTELGGTLSMKKRRSAGISLERLLAAPVTVRLRQGGERIQPDARRPRRSLKNLMQEARVPPWVRGRLPLLFSGQTLVFVPGIGIDAAYQAASGEPGVEPSWEIH